MDEKVEKVEAANITHRIISAGLNSLSMTKPEDLELLNQFSVQSFDVILSCWPHINEMVKFQIFKNHIEAFRLFLAREVEEGKKYGSL